MSLLEKIKSKEAKIGVIGLGYVGLPLVFEFCKAGFKVTGFDIDNEKVKALSEGRSYIKHIDSSKVKECHASFSATTDFSKISAMDCLIICVPTPLNKYREPDLSYVFNTTRTISRYMSKGQLIVLESTTYPGTTDEDMRAILEEAGMKAGVDFHLAFSPEREDPNRQDFSISTTPKIVSGYTPACLEATKALYDFIVVKTVPVSSTKVAESAKLLENIYRCVNIALVNELKMLFDKMGIDVWEVVRAASTKPFGFQAFYPGPGLGGHCIPIDPFYLTWKARQYEIPTKFIELAGEVNTAMPYYVVQKTFEALNDHGKSIRNSKILVMGLAYKKNVDDARESPSIKLIELLEEKGAHVDYNDPFIPVPPKMREHNLRDMVSVELTAGNLAKYDCVIISADHDAYDPEFIANNAKLVVDTRNLIKDYTRYAGKVTRA